MTTTRTEKLDDLVREAREKNILRSPAELSDAVAMVPELFVALLTGRPEFIKIAKPRALNEDEAKAVFHLVGTLIETNMLMREHAEKLGQQVKLWADHFKPLARLGVEIENFASYNTSHLDQKDAA